MIVLCDLDSVLNVLWVTWQNAHNEECMKCKTPIDYTQIDNWNIGDTLACGHDIYKYLKRRDIYENAPVNIGAVEGTKRILELGHELYVVTASDNGEAIIGKHNFLLRHFPHIKKRNYIVCNNKALIRGDIIIDDHLDNLIHPAPTKIVLDYGWNRKLSDKHKQNIPHLFRAYGWDDIVQVIEHIS